MRTACLLAFWVVTTLLWAGGASYDYIAPEEIVPYPTGAGSVYAVMSKPTSGYTPAVQPMHAGASKRWAEKTGQSSAPANETAVMKVTKVNSNWFFVGWTKNSKWSEGSTILSTGLDYSESGALPYYQVQLSSTGEYKDRAGKINEWANNNKDKCEFYFANFARVKASTDDTEGVVSCMPLVNQDGDVVTLTASNTNSDKHFAGWKLNNQLVSTEQTYSFAVTNDKYGDYVAVFSVAVFPEDGTYVFKNVGTQKYASYGTDVLSPSANRDIDYCTPFTIQVEDDGKLSVFSSNGEDVYAYKSALTLFAHEVMEQLGASADPSAFVDAASVVYLESAEGGYRAYHQLPALTCGKSWSEVKAAASAILQTTESLNNQQKAFVAKLLEAGAEPGGKYYLVASNDGSAINYVVNGDSNYALWNTEGPTNTESLYTIGDGWRRLKNVGTGNYASFVGNDFTISQNIDFDGVAAMKSPDQVLSDPGSVFWVRNNTGNSDIYSHGYGIRNGSGEWLAISAGDGPYALLYVEKYGFSFYLNDKGNGQLSGVQNDHSSATTHWSLEPISAETADKFYFGAKCGAKFTDGEGKYYTTMYTYFPYQCMDGVKAYYAKEANVTDGVGEVICKEITSGKVPANTAVILECNGLTPKENRLVPLPCTYNYQVPSVTPIDKSVTPITDNLLIGTYFNLNFNGHINRTKYDPEKHLTFSISDEGSLGFYKWSGQYLTPAKAYLDLTKISASANSFRLTLTSEEDGVEQVRPAVRMTPAGVYDLQGRKVAESVDENLSLPKGIYIVNGKKIVIR